MSNGNDIAAEALNTRLPKVPPTMEEVKPVPGSIMKVTINVYLKVCDFFFF